MPSDMVSRREADSAASAGKARNSKRRGRSARIAPNLDRPDGLSSRRLAGHQTFQPVDVVVPGDDVRVGHQLLEERDVGVDAGHHDLAEASAEAGDALLAVAAVDD